MPAVRIAIMESSRTPRRGGLLKSLAHLGLGQVATTVLSILLIATLARSLGPADFGVYFLAMSIAGFTYVVVDWGYGPLVIRETARDHGRAGDLLGSTLLARGVVALFGCTLAVTTTWLLGYDERTCIVTGALILALLPQYLGLSFGWVFRAHERMDRDAQLNVALKLMMLLGSFACLWLGGRLLSLILAWAIAGFLTLMIAFLMWRSLSLPKLTATVATARGLLREGASIFTMTLAGAVEPFINANIMYKMASPAVVGWYGAAWTIAGTLIAPATIVGAAMYPRLSTTAGNETEFRRVLESSFKPLFLLAVLGALGAYLFADFAVGLIYGLEKFAPTAEDLRAFAPVLLLMYVDVFLSMAIFALGKSGWLAVTKVASVLLTTALAFVLVPLFQARFGNGGLGVMYALGLGELLMFVVAAFLMRDVMGRRTIGNVLRGLAAGMLTALSFWLFPQMPPYLAIPLCVALFGAFLFLCGAVKPSEVGEFVTALRGAAPVDPDRGT